MAVKNTSKTLPKIRDTGKKLRRVSHAKIAEALGAEPFESTIHLKGKDAKEFLDILDDPPKPNKRLIAAAKRFMRNEEYLPIAPEVCQECRDGFHVMHVIDELGDLYVGKVGTHFFIHGTAENEPDHFWLRRILQMAYEAVRSKRSLGEHFDPVIQKIMPVLEKKK